MEPSETDPIPHIHSIEAMGDDEIGVTFTSCSPVATVKGVVSAVVTIEMEDPERNHQWRLV